MNKIVNNPMDRINTKSKENYQRRCQLCNTEYLFKQNFFNHLAGKRHLKNSKHKPDNLESNKRTLCVRGIPKGTLVKVLDCFWPYGLIDAFITGSFSFIEFETHEGALKASKDEHIIDGHKLVIDFKRVSKDIEIKPSKFLPETPNKGIFGRKTTSTLRISQSLIEKIKQVISDEEIDLTILQLIDEIELKPKDYREREYVRFTMENFLRTLFPAAQAWVFGSSINSLGFAGCDIDMFADLGFDLWSSGTKQEIEQKASELTRYLANQIKKRRKGYNISQLNEFSIEAWSNQEKMQTQRVVSIPRARVPIVKFRDYNKGIEVDLSFRSPMPICNTSLIKLYASTHSIVRPYLMFLRYWGKIQGVVGGAQPDTLLTNYCFAMMMLFIIMNRQSPIIPSVSDLKERLYVTSQNQYKPVIVEGWDCSFSEDVQDWVKKHHKITLVSLAQEFFDFYSKLETDNFVVSPLVGKLISREVLSKQDPRFLPAVLHPYCTVSYNFQVNRIPFCVQDPFQHNFNLSKGLSAYSLMAFRHKCCHAAEICKLIKQKKSSLSKLFEPIQVKPGELIPNTKPEAIVMEESSPESIQAIDDNDDDIAILFESTNDKDETVQNKNVVETILLNDDTPQTNSEVTIPNLTLDVCEKDVDKENPIANIVEGKSSDKVLKDDNGIDCEINDNLDTSIIGWIEDTGNEKSTSKLSKEITSSETLLVDSLERSYNVNSKLNIESREMLLIDSYIAKVDGNSEVGSDNQPKSHNNSTEGKQSANEARQSDALDDCSLQLTSPVLIPEFNKFDISFHTMQEFSIQKDGLIIVEDGKMMTSYMRRKKVTELIKFILQNCFMCTIEDYSSLEIASEELSTKRKLISTDDDSIIVPNKKVKNESGNATQIKNNFVHLCTIKCTFIVDAWKNRKVVKRNFFKLHKFTPKNCRLRNERAIAEILVKDNSLNSQKLEISKKSYITIWEKRLQPGEFCITNRAIAKDIKMLKPFFQTFASLVKDIFVDTLDHLKFQI